MILYFFNHLNKANKIMVIMFHHNIEETRCHQSLEMKKAKSKHHKPPMNKSNLLIFNILNTQHRTKTLKKNHQRKLKQMLAIVEPRNK